MKQSIRICILFAVILASGGASVRAWELEGLSVPGLASAEVPVPAPDSRPSRDWTVLIYVSARNNLGLEAIKDVNEMEAAGSTARVAVAVEMGRIVTASPFNPFSSTQEPLPPQADWTGSRRRAILYNIPRWTASYRSLF
ncbi:MAG: hypothetical protein M0011_01735 [Elusimicrobia bacterium]|nr:hypothetical protein [Elusimicrobiota bacterium]